MAPAAQHLSQSHSTRWTMVTQKTEGWLSSISIRPFLRLCHRWNHPHGVQEQGQSRGGESRHRQGDGKQSRIWLSPLKSPLKKTKQKINSIDGARRYPDLVYCRRSTSTSWTCLRPRRSGSSPRASRKSSKPSMCWWAVFEITLFWSRIAIVYI